MFEFPSLTNSLDTTTAISLVGLLYLVLALLAAVHVLLHKRNEGAAISWLGVIVLSPLFGALVYGLFGINRMRGRAQSVHSDAAEERAATIGPSQPAIVAAPIIESHPALQDLLKTGLALHGNPMLSGNAVRALVNGDEAYPVMLDAISNAQHSVLLSSYIFQSDAIGKQFVSALTAAHKRGVTVRVLIDGVGARYGLLVGRADRALRKLGVKTARFLPASSPLDWRFINLRNHRKLMIVDSTQAFIGGLNIRQGNVLATAKRHQTCDVHFCVSGPVVQPLADVFVSDWFFSTREVLKLKPSSPNQTSEGAVRCRVLVDGPDNNYEKLRLSLIAAINVAQERIAIVTPYFLPNSALLASLRLAVLRGVEVQVLLPERNNLRVVEWAMRANERQWLEAGLKISLTNAPFDHSKFFIVDDEWSMVGSSNWDARSLELNFEVNLECVDRELNGILLALLQQKKLNSQPLLEHRDRAIVLRLRNNFCRLFSPFL